MLDSTLIDVEIDEIDIKKELDYIKSKFNLVISLHCKQLFPVDLWTSVKCINVHPGLNPYNRGWYPQVFSIINQLPIGATIHEIDNQIDHGPIIASKKIEQVSWDNSFTLHNKIIAAELELIENHIDSILDGTYNSRIMENEGNLNYQSDYEKLKLIDLNEVSTYENVINHLRAMTHENYKNAYFIDPKSGKKIFVKIDLTPES